jgi:hypothetical protein
MITKALKRHFATRHAQAGNSFNFPKHKELFTEDYYNPEDANAAPPNAYRSGFVYGADNVDFQKPVHRATPTGILATYKKQLNLTAADLMQKDYWDQMNTLEQDTARKLRETKPEVFTAEMVNRLRMQRDVTAPFEKDGHEYGNYEKYEKNKVEWKTEKGEGDDGTEKFFKNYRNMLKQINNVEGEEVKDEEEASIK